MYLSTADSYTSMSLVFQIQEISEKVLETLDLNFESLISNGSEISERSSEISIDRHTGKLA